MSRPDLKKVGRVWVGCRSDSAWPHTGCGASQKFKRRANHRQSKIHARPFLQPVGRPRSPGQSLTLSFTASAQPAAASFLGATNSRRPCEYIQTPRDHIFNHLTSVSLSSTIPSLTLTQPKSTREYIAMCSSDIFLGILAILFPPLPGKPYPSETVSPR